MPFATGAHGDVADIHRVVDGVYRAESRRVLATLIRLLGDFDIAEEALHDAFIAAVEQWPREGVPQNPRAWLVSTGRFKAIDRIRRRSKFDVSLEDVAEQIEAIPAPEIANEHGHVEDDRLRLIFTCCHPALAPDAQVALTLREVCALTTEEIARAHLTAPATVAQRIVRAKAKIRDARVPYEVPGRSELAERLDGVLRVIYLVFNEGYLASSGEALVRRSLTAEAIRLGRLLVELLPEPEAVGLLALMMLHESRHAARASPSGELVLQRDGGRSGARVPSLRCLHAAGGYRSRARGSARRRSDRLGPDRGAVRCAAALRPLAGGRAEPRRCSGDARWACSRPGRDRCDPRPRRSCRLPPRPLGPSRPLPPPRRP